MTLHLRYEGWKHIEYMVFMVVKEIEEGWE